MFVITLCYTSRGVAVLQIPCYEVGQICWCLHVCYPGCRDHCVHVHHLFHCEGNQESHQTKKEILLCEYSVHSILFLTIYVVKWGLTLRFVIISTFPSN